MAFIVTAAKRPVRKEAAASAVGSEALAVRVTLGLLAFAILLVGWQFWPRETGVAHAAPALAAQEQAAQMVRVNARLSLSLAETQKKLDKSLQSLKQHERKIFQLQEQINGLKQLLSSVPGIEGTPGQYYTEGE